MTTDDREIVSALRAALADKVGQQRCELWFGPATRLTVTPQALLIEVGTPFQQNWLRTQFRGELEEACRCVLGAVLPIEFAVDPDLDRPLLSHAGADHSEESAAAASPPHGKLAATAADGSTSTHEFAEAPTLRRTLANWDSFVVGPGNRLAHAAALDVVEQLGRVSPLFLHGPTSVGKTHLMESIATSVRQRRRGSVLYLSAEQFTTHFLQALHGSGLPSFRHKHRSADVLLIDDVQFFAKKTATLNEVQHTIDVLLRAGKQLVFAADRAPKDLSGFGPELTSRLSGGLACPLEPPDLPTRQGIVRQMAEARSLAAPDAVWEYIATQFTSHARDLSGAMNRLEAASRAAGVPITLALAEETLGELIRGARTVQLQDIEAAVCKTFGVTAADIKTASKSKAAHAPRILAMWLARKHTRAALSDISRHFGRRSHSTVLAAEKTVGQWMSQRSEVELARRAWPIEDAIRRVEQTLLAG